MFVAVVDRLLNWSKILAVISEVLVPSAIMLVGETVLISLVGTGTGVMSTFTVPSFKSVAVELTVAVPGVAVDRNLTVASPAPAAFVVVFNNVP